ncbi:MAG: DUF6475 domain-containing protein [bacterium]
MLNKTEKQELVDIVSGLAEYYNISLTEYIVYAYLEDLNEFSLNDIKKAVSIIRKQSSYMPKTADILKIIRPEHSIQEKAEIAWGYVYETIHTADIYTSFTFLDNVIRAVIHYMDWEMICTCSDEKLVWVKKDFISRYLAYFRIALNMNPPAYFKGLNERLNGDIWGDLNKTVYIAEIKKTVKLEKLVEYFPDKNIKVNMSSQFADSISHIVKKITI